LTGKEDPVERAKRAAGREAAKMVRAGQIVGLGTGSTAALAIEELGLRVRDEGLAIVGVATSYQAAALARRAGIPVRSLEEIGRIDVAIDGADEADPRKNLIKGGGAAHTREKVIASEAALFIVVLDESKLVAHLGERSPVPVEAIPMAAAVVARRLEALGGQPELRMGIRKDGPVITDNGNVVIDVQFGPIADPLRLEKAINEIPGVVDNGLFIGLADLLLVGEMGSEVVRRID
jgi:ribose 5-phosphate isomerase A